MLVNFPDPHSKYTVGWDSNPDKGSKAHVLTKQNKKLAGRLKRKRDLKMDRREKAAFIAFSTCVPWSSSGEAFNLSLPSCQLSESSLFVVQESPPICLVASLTGSGWNSPLPTSPRPSSRLLTQRIPHMSEREFPQEEPGMHLTAEHTFLLFAQLYLLLLMVEKGGSKDTWF